MARTKRKKVPNKRQLLKHWVWCPEGSTARIKRGKWIHHLTCEHKQAQQNNNCLGSCGWYRMLEKLNDVNRRTLVNSIHYHSQATNALIDAKLGDKKKVREYIKSIPKDK